MAAMGEASWHLSVTNSATQTTADNITIDHNTVFADSAFLVFGDSGTIPNFQFTNNLGTYGNYGITWQRGGVRSASFEHLRSECRLWPESAY